MPDAKNQLAEDCYNAVYNDDYIWLCVWGPPRVSKTTLAGWILYSLYKDWDKVLQAFGYNLTQIVYKMRHGIPERWPTRNGMHTRVPALNWDDFGAHSNKASTQHDKGWDEFKGGFDVLGTQIGVLITTMVDPNEPTFQLLNKFTAEVQILSRGVYKYDRVVWKQDYRGWKNRVQKIFVEENRFPEWPKEVYQEYNVQRESLVDEVFQRIEDASSESLVANYVRLCQPMDIEILELLEKRGEIDSHVLDGFGEPGRLTMTRLKSRALAISNKRAAHYYKVDISALGLSVLKAYREQKGRQSP